MPLQQDLPFAENIKQASATEVQNKSRSPHKAWHWIQAVVWLVGASIIALLFFKPTIGIHAFWNVLIPVAPALLVFLPALWRNICPMGTTALLPRHIGLSKRRIIDSNTQRNLGFAGLMLLLLIVPLRHTVLDLNGPATAIAILTLTVTGILLGLQYEWKSAWCSGLCPIHPVERLYGNSPAATLPNGHCDSCHICIHICPDSSMGTSFIDQQKKDGLAGLTPTILIGGFPGYIWGWFQVADYYPAEGMAHLPETYAWPFIGMLISMAGYLLLKSTLAAQGTRTLARAFAAFSVSMYYWYRIPALFGFGIFPEDGMLVDLTGTLPASFPIAARAGVVLLFSWWFMLRKSKSKSWAYRPEWAEA